MQWNHMWKVLSEQIRVRLLPLSTLNEGVAKWLSFKFWDTAFLPPSLESNLGGEMFWDLGMVVSGRWGRVLPRAPGVPAILSRTQWFSNCHVPENHPSPVSPRDGVRLHRSWGVALLQRLGIQILNPNLDCCAPPVPTQQSWAGRKADVSSAEMWSSSLLFLSF